MSREEIIRFNQDLQTNEDLRKRIETNQDGAESLAGAAQANGYDFTDEELARFVEQLTAQTDGSLDEAELEQVAGGLGPAMPKTPAEYEISDQIRRSFGLPGYGMLM